jgi:1,4-alpha-glucan branching enzyme
MMQSRIHWRLGLGAEVENAGVRFRVWAPKHRRLEVVIEGEGGGAFPLEREDKGYFSGTVLGIGAGVRYRYRLYGDPDGLKRFVDAAHRNGMAVILDVVYNHVGPDGNYLKAFSDDYFTDRYQNEWGEAINFDGPGSKEVCEFFIRNACYWIAEFHLDGLRLDATQQIFDASPRHILAELSRRAREAALPREIVLIGENESQQVIALAPVVKGVRT